MENLKLPGYQINEYKLVLIPHEALSLRIIDMRKSLNLKFDVEKPINSLPEVILVKFNQLQMNEARIIHRLRIIGMGMPAIKVEIKDFGSLPSHSIFLNITSKVPIGNLVKRIKTEAQQLLKLDTDNKPHFMTDSYIALARMLKPWQYEKAWLEYCNLSFTGKFIAGRILLLKRKQGEVKLYKPIANFDLLNMPVNTTQGVLF